MKQAYLFVHFREKTTPDGEQVYFSVSKDGFNWEELNQGKPVLWTFYGDKGVRDFTVTRCRKTCKTVILATDLSLSLGMRNQYHHSWAEIGRNGSKCFSMWESENMTDWTEQKLVKIGDENFGCLWAPDIIYDPEQDDYVLHWSTCHRENDYGPMAIYYSRTSDFVHWSKPALLYRKEDAGCIDSAMYEENGRYYLFVKSDSNPETMIELVSDHVTGPFERVWAFDKSMSVIEAGKYEAPTAVRLDDGRWCLFIDYYGVQGAGQGYIPFVAPSMASGDFVRSDASFAFPYGFKHGTILTITPEEYDRMMARDWMDVPDKRW